MIAVNLRNLDIHIDSYISKIIILNYIANPFYFLFFLLGIDTSVLFDYSIKIVTVLIIPAVILKAKIQQKLLKIIICSIMIMVYLMHEAIYGAPLSLLIRGYVYDFLFLFAILIGIRFEKKYYYNAFKFLSVSNSIYIIILFILFISMPRIGILYFDYLISFGRTGNVTFIGELPRLNGLFSTAQVAAVVSTIGSLICLREKQWLLMVICLLGAALTLAKSTLGMLTIGLTILLFQKGTWFNRFVFFLVVIVVLSGIFFQYSDFYDWKHEIEVVLSVSESAMDFLLRSPIIGNGFAIYKDSEELSEYIKKAPIFNGELAVRLGRSDYLELAFLAPWITHGVFYFIIYYSALLFRYRWILPQYAFLLLLLIFSNFHYWVTAFPLNIILFALAGANIKADVVDDGILTNHKNLVRKS